jgi:hypothetical protein
VVPAFLVIGQQIGRAIKVKKPQYLQVVKLRIGGILSKKFTCLVVLKPATQTALDAWEAALSMLGNPRFAKSSWIRVLLV